MKKLFLTFIIQCFFANAFFAQLPNIPPPPVNIIPPVINYHHISISGVSLVLQNNVQTYTADFFYPAEAHHLEWVVAGGTIIGSNTGTSVTVVWDFASNIPNPIPLPPGITIDPDAKGAIAIKQGQVFNNKIYQAAYLYIYDIGTGTKGSPFAGCKQTPATQSLNYLQPPCLISGVPECITPGISHTYQWKYYDNGLQLWNPISGPGTNGVNYQPPNVTQDMQYGRETNDINGNTNFTRGGVSVLLNNFSPGTLYADNFTIPFGQQPVVIDEMPYGGTCQSAAYLFSWEASYNNGPWQVLGTTLHSPNLPLGITKESVRIRRGSKCGSAAFSYTNILEFGMVNGIGAPPSENQNYVREVSIVTKGVQSPLEASFLNTGDKIQVTKYFDGLSRPVQAVSKETGTPMPSNPAVWQDVVTPQKYDDAGRQTQGYLTYATVGNIGLYKPDAFTEQPNYYTINYNETPSYSQANFEANPLNRISNSKKAGSAWAASAGNSIEYDINDVTEDVKIWTIGPAVAGALPAITVTGVYATGQLIKTTYIDEKNVRIVEYQDKSGNLILRKTALVSGTPSSSFSQWLSTYNIYDDFNRLRAIITPKASDYAFSNGWVIGSNSTTFKELCYYNEYDYKGRLVIKQTPQGGSQRYVYDARDRLVLTQDENQSTGYYTAGTAQWSFNLYDDLNRLKVTGIFNSNASRDNMEQQVNALSVSNTVISVSLGGAAENVTVYSPVTALGTGIQYNSIKYYDDYTYAGSKSFNPAHNIPASADPNVDAISVSTRTASLETGAKLRVLDNSGKVLVSTVFYDEETRVIQTISDNIKNGEDVKTSQYDFAQKVQQTSSIHTAQNTGYTNYTILTKHSFDKIGRITMVSKKFGPAAYKDIAAYSYDDFGRVKLKQLGLNPISGGAQVESLEYTYNLNGQMTGINKFYALKDPARYNKWNNFFGLYLGYDNKDGAFSLAELNGNITGVMWNTQGDDAQRKYNYLYDFVNRLIRATFTQKDDPASTWTNTKFNFNVGGTVGNRIGYDLNGNIIRMTQFGVLPGETPRWIDNLYYTYGNGFYSNRLMRVDDFTSSLPSNGTLGDFKEGANGTSGTDDYAYDDNGNLVMDENKGIKNLVGTRGVKYNYLDKVEEMKIDGKGTAKFVYDAAGNKLQKIFTPVTGTAKTISYIDEYVYEGNDLQFINFEEGRLRIITQIALAYKTLSGNFNMPVPPGTPASVIKQGVFDYFIKDHLGNTRMVLTEEQQWAKGICTMEDPNPAAALAEESQWGQVLLNGNPDPNVNEVAQTRDYVPSSWSSNPNPNPPLATPIFRCAKLYDAAKKRIGPNSILKVMAGDEITASAIYYYANNSNSANQTGLSGSLLTSLTYSIFGSSVSSLVKAKQPFDYNSILTTPLNTFVSAMPTNGINPNPAAPRAYINIIYLDEQFNYIGSAQPVRVDAAGDALHEVRITADKAPKNGYAYIFLSNESTEPVFFDNFTVEHKRSRIVEESHYYPFGLKITAISSRKLGDAENGSLQNRYGYQGDFAEEDEETGWNEFDLRNYDPQIGRWTGVDPYDEYPSPYTGMGNNPANLIDEDGGGVGSLLGAAAFFTAGYLIANNNIHDENDDRRHFQAALIGLGSAFLGAGIGYGIENSLVGEHTGHFGAHFRAFYEGIFGTKTDVQASYRAVIGGNDGTSIPVPDFKVNWPKIGNLKLFEWVDDNAYIWKIVQIQSWVTQQWVNKDALDQTMGRNVTINSMGQIFPPPIVNVVDVLKTKVPFSTGKERTKTRWKVENPNVSGGIFERTLFDNQSGSDYSITIRHRAPSGTGVDYTTGRINVSYVPVETKLSIITKQRKATPVKRLKIFGFKTLIYRR
jgi:RHS repeat-associated protein